MIRPLNKTGLYPTYKIVTFAFGTTVALLLFLLFIAVPIIEIAVFIQVGGLIGLWPTIGIVIVTAVIGTALLRRQGLRTLMQAQQSMQSGAFPLKEVFHGACLLVGGVMLLTPGFVTDAFGFLLLIPWFRDILAIWGLEYLRKRQINNEFRGPGGNSRRPPGQSPDQTGPKRGEDGIIEGEFVEVTRENDPPPRDGQSSPDSPWYRNDK